MSGDYRVNHAVGRPPTLDCRASSDDCIDLYMHGLPSEPAIP
jgi:hypothetical protein